MRHHQLLAASAMALALAAAPLSAEAANIVQTLKDSGNYSQVVDALNKAGLSSTLEGSGPYTVFAPTDEAFQKLQQQGMTSLSKEQGTLGQVLKHHVVEGKELTAKAVLGKETKVSTLSGDELSVDGTGAVVMLVPAGLQVTRIGDEVFVRREVAPIAAPAVTVSTTGGQSEQGQQQASSQAGSSSGGSQSSGQPQQASNQSGSNQTGGESGSKSSQQMAGQSSGGGQGQSGSEQGQPVEQQQGLLRAAMVVEPDIQADNGVIHGINEVLVPQKIEQQLMQESGQQNQQSNQQGSQG